MRHKGKIDQCIDFAVVEVNNVTKGTKKMIYTNKYGNYSVKLKPDCDYIVKASKPMFFAITPPKNFSMIGKKVSEKFSANFELDEVIIDKPIVLENIYYDLDKWFIRTDAKVELDRLAQLMSDNPKLMIEVSSHTDSRAGDQYNLVLSDKRAKQPLNISFPKGLMSNV